MVLMIVALLLIAGFAFYQAIQGAFSAMIMTILTVLCAALAFNYYEPLAMTLVGKGYAGAYAHGLSLLACFVIPLLVLREIFDRTIRGNVMLGLWADRIGGGVFGVLTALVLVGVLMIVVQLLPFPATILTYQPYDATLEPHHGGPVRWSGRFTLGLVKHLSAGAFRPVGDGRRFGQAHEDLLLEAFCIRSRQPGARTWAGPKALEVSDAHFLEMPDREEILARKLAPAQVEALRTSLRRIQDAVPKSPRALMPLTALSRLLTARVLVDETARNEKDNWFRLPATHFRLVTRSGRSFYPLAYLAYAGGWRVVSAVGENRIAKVAEVSVARPWSSSGGPKKLTVDWVFRLPRREEPAYIVFRRCAAADVPPAVAGLPKPEGALGVKSAVGEVEFVAAATGRRLFVPLQAKVGTKMPGITLWISEGAPRPRPLKRAQIEGDRLRSGLIDGATKELSPAVGPGRNARVVSNLYTPAGNYSIVQVRCRASGSALSRADADRLARMTPRLVLSKGAPVGHSGAYIRYRRGQQQYVYLYYDAGARPENFDSAWVQTFTTYAQNIEDMGIFFVVPSAKGRQVISLDLGVGPEYEFSTASPLECTR